MCKVTIAMPVYNVERYVERALKSALNQTFNDIDYLIIDDKGTDGSMDIVQQVINTHPRGKSVRIVDHIINRGTGATKNTAIDETDSSFLYFMDSDDEITPDCIEKLYNLAITSNADFVASSVVRYAENGERSLIQYQDMTLKTNSDLINYQISGIYTPIIVPTWNKMFRTDFLRSNNIRCIPHQKGEDDIFTFQVLYWAQICVLYSGCTYLNYQNASSFTGKMRVAGISPMVADELLEIVFYQIEYISAHPMHASVDIFKQMVLGKMIGGCNMIIDSKVIPIRKKVQYIKHLWRMNKKLSTQKLSSLKRVFLASRVLPGYLLYFQFYILKKIR